MTNLEKIKYIDEKMSHLRIQKKRILKEIIKLKREDFNKNLSDKDMLAKRYCKGEKISSLAKEFKISYGAMYEKVKNTLRKRAIEQSLMKDDPYIWHRGIEYYKKILKLYD